MHQINRTLFAHLLALGGRERQAVDASGGGHEGLRLVRVRLSKQAEHDRLSFTLERLGLIGRSDRLQRSESRREDTRW